MRFAQFERRPLGSFSGGRLYVRFPLVFVADTFRGFIPMLEKMFSSTEVDRFADWVVAEVKKALPTAPNPAANNIAKRAERLTKQIDQQTKIFCKTTKLGIYKRARLAARVREGMLAHGYNAPFVKAFSYDLLRGIQAATSARNKSAAPKTAS
jgi:hypothetical protein